MFRVRGTYPRQNDSSAPHPARPETDECTQRSCDSRIEKQRVHTIGVSTSDETENERPIVFRPFFHGARAIKRIKRFVRNAIREIVLPSRRTGLFKRKPILFYFRSLRPFRLR